MPSLIGSDKLDPYSSSYGNLNFNEGGAKIYIYIYIYPLYNPVSTLPLLPVPPHTSPPPFSLEGKPPCMLPGVTKRQTTPLEVSNKAKLYS